MKYAFFSDNSVFADLTTERLKKLSSQANARYLRAGEFLYKEGDELNHFYFLVSGRLKVTREGELTGYIGRRSLVGEMGVLAHKPRSSTLQAVRDCYLLFIPKDIFLDFLEQEPKVLLKLSALLIERLRQPHHERQRLALETQKNIALLPASKAVPVIPLAEKLVRLQEGWPKARLITAAHVDAEFGEGAAASPFTQEFQESFITWCDRLEGQHDFIIFAADNSDDNWAKRCLTQADRILVLAESNAPPRAIRAFDIFEEKQAVALVEQVLLRSEGDSSPYTQDWKRTTHSRAHYFLHPWDNKELAALSRQVTGHGIGLVLGGGGARGFAHLGLLRALEELGIPIDVLGGTSMGAFVGALYATGFDIVEMTHIARETFVNNNFLNDYTLPRVSLIRGRRFRHRLEEIFGDRRVENLRRTFFCISTNLTRGGSVVHDRGHLATCVGTSMAVPGVAPPVAFRGNLLCDGGVVDNLPTGIMQGLERGLILASSVSSAADISVPHLSSSQPDPEALLRWEGKGIRPSLGEILVRTATLTSDTLIQREAAERADIYLRMPVEEYGMFDWRKLNELIEIGYEFALKELAPHAKSLSANSV